MLKRKRKINKAILIASSRYTGPLPKAYASLLRCGTAPELAECMVQDIWLTGIHNGDSGNVWRLCCWSYTGYENDWRRAGVEFLRINKAWRV